MQREAARGKRWAGMDAAALLDMRTARRAMLCHAVRCCTALCCAVQVATREDPSSARYRETLWCASSRLHRVSGGYLEGCIPDTHLPVCRALGVSVSTRDKGLKAALPPSCDSQAASRVRRVGCPLHLADWRKHERSQGLPAPEHLGQYSGWVFGGAAAAGGARPPAALPAEQACAMQLLLVLPGTAFQSCKLRVKCVRGGSMDRTQKHASWDSAQQNTLLALAPPTCSFTAFPM